MKRSFSWRQFFILMGLVGALQFLVLTSAAMYWYPGGTIHQPQLESYSFLNNYFSDLGRTRCFDRESNMLCHYLFKTALTISGITLILFFGVVPSLFSNPISKGLGSFAALLGIAAGLCYIGIGWIPWNEHYWQHTWYVRWGFIAFLGMSLVYTPAIFADRQYPDRYGWAFLIFAGVLAVQIVIMLFGPRAYRSGEALFLQAVSQKVVVYAEIGVMIYQAWGAYRLAGNKEIL